jgi:hypothetical protein
MKEGAAQRPPLFLLKLVFKHRAFPFSGVDIQHLFNLAFVDIEYPTVQVRELAFFPSFLDDRRLG